MILPGALTEIPSAMVLLPPTDFSSPALKELVDEIAALSVNIVEVVHDRLSSNVDAGSAGVSLSLETEGQEHAEKLIEHLKEKNIKFTILT